MTSRHSTPTAETRPAGTATGPAPPGPPRARRRRTVLLALLAGLVLVACAVPYAVDRLGGGGGAGAGASGGEDTDGFVTARTSAPPVGSGTMRRFKVRVEDGLGLSADTAAKDVYRVLADRRSWTADGHDGFQLVSSGARDFVVVIASPATVDRLCGAAGLKTHGEVNCSVGSRVIVNVKRWNTGSPEFSGPLADYRALIINHEVGHRIGHGHEGCPGPGRPAPAMMQQIDGLDGCTPNAWPYSRDGHYLGGPKVP